MRIAMVGMGRMGTAIAARLRAAGHKLALYDPLLEAGAEVHPSLADAARGAEVCLLCLPDAAAVQASLEGLAEAAPPLVVDMTSSLPATTRRMAAELAPLGVAYLDCPLSGGTAAAGEGTLTAMVGGDPTVAERVRPLLDELATTVAWAGPLGAGHVTKALNNALSAVSMTSTAEMLVTAVAYGQAEANVIAGFNAWGARSLNSQERFPRHVLSRRYGAGFTAGLMERDLGTAMAVASAGGTETPFLQGTLRVWQQVVRVLGRNRDFTMVHAVVTTLSQAKVISSAQCSVELLARACAAMNLIAAREAVRVARGEDLDVQRFLAIVNASSGGSEATRSDLRGDTDVDALVQARGLARRAQVWAPLTTLAAEL